MGLYYIGVEFDELLPSNRRWPTRTDSPLHNDWVTQSGLFQTPGDAHKKGIP